LAAAAAAGLWVTMSTPVLAEARTRDGALDETLPQISTHGLTQSAPAELPKHDPSEIEHPKAAPKSKEAQPQPPDDAQKRGEAKSRLVSILGREITNRDGDAGRVIDVLIDLDGRAGAAVVEFGGFMGIGSRKVVVDWSAVRLVRDGNRTVIVVDISREQIRDAAEYKPGEPVSVLGSK
jgi:hypothetical protein